jgi:hypothetical protein
MKVSPADREARLDQIRQTARQRGEITGPGMRAAGGPIPTRPGYHGEAVVRPPVWTWEIPLYFFVGGAAGMAPTIACLALLFHQPEITRVAMWIAGVGSILSPILLIADLGRPQLFLNMLRVFKWRSAMSMGAWILTFFGPCAGAGWVLYEMYTQGAFAPSVNWLVLPVAVIFMIGAAICGLLLATYTGVLIGATAVPAWHKHHLLLPIHFGIAGLGTAAAICEMCGQHARSLYAIGLAVSMIEIVLWLWLEIDRHGKADGAVHEGKSGWMIRGAELLTGPLSLLLRLSGNVPVAAFSFALGAFVSRFGWMEAGRVSGRDPEAVFAEQSAR